MVAKIGHGANISGALFYNYQKVENEKGQILYMHNMSETPDNNYTIDQLFSSFKPYLWANKKTEKPALHISLNPDPKDKVNDETFINIAHDYMDTMDYGNQPFIVFKHTDTGRTHIHIVSINVDRNGKKISDTFEKRRSMYICRELEQKYNLISAPKHEKQKNNTIFKTVDYRAGDLKSQVASVVRYIPKHYRFQNLGTYNALLSLFNIKAEEVHGEMNGTQKSGLVYFVLDENGEKVSNPFKASLFGKQAGYAQLQEYFKRSREYLINNSSKASIKNIIEIAMHTCQTESEFKKSLLDQDIAIIVRQNNDGRIYGITFVDHQHKNVWNGSQLDKNLSANVFNDWWTYGKKPDTQKIVSNSNTHHSLDKISDHKESHHFFDFISDKTEFPVYDENGIIESLGGLLPLAQSEDGEESAFENWMKKIKKKRRKK